VSTDREAGVQTTVHEMSSYHISTDAAQLDISAIHAYLSQSYWAKRIPLATLCTAIDHSVCVGAKLNGHQVGFARVVTDRATFAYVADVYVLDAHRGKGVARAMLSALFALPALQGLRRLLLITRDAHGLYAKLGFTALEQPARFMERQTPRAY